MLNTRLDIYCANMMIIMIKEQKTEKKKVEVMRVFTMRMKMKAQNQPDDVRMMVDVLGSGSFNIFNIYVNALIKIHT